MARLWRGLFRYSESELDPAVQAEILLESARSEARVAILEILLAFGFAFAYRLEGEPVRAIALFVVITVIPLLIDAALRRSAAKRLLGRGPQLPGSPRRR